MSDAEADGPPSGPIDSRARARLLLSNSTLALVLAALVSIVTHELAHAVAGLLRGLRPTVYATQVTFAEPGSVATQAITAAAGPLWSLALGIVCCNFGQSLGRGFGRLFSMWLGLIALQNFAGYLLIVPFAANGDTARVFALLRLPGWVYVLAGVFGVLLTLLNGRLLAGRVMRYARGTKALRRTVLFPWLIGTAVVLVVVIAAQAQVSLNAANVSLVVSSAAAIAIFAPLFTLFYRGLSPHYVRLDLKIPAIPLLVTVAAISLYLGVLGSGIALR